LSTVKGNIKFTGEDQKEFFQVLRQRVDQYFIDNNISKYANGLMVFIDKYADRDKLREVLLLLGVL
jgi:hypothetical protein